MRKRKRRQEKNKKDTIMEETHKKIEDMVIAEEKQEKQSVQDIHDTGTPIEALNLLTTKDLKKILDQTTLQARLCENPILVSVEKIQKVVIDIIRDKLNIQEPHSVMPLDTSVQHLVKTSNETSTNVDTTIKVDMVEQKTQTAQEEKATKARIG